MALPEQCRMAHFVALFSFIYEVKPQKCGMARYFCYFDSLSNGLLELYDEPINFDRKTSGSFDYYSPVHFIIELTDRCNLKCKHCYRESGPQNNKMLPVAQLLNILQDMAESGINTVELSGGEHTIHPNLKKILQFCSKNFNIVTIISNGWFIDDNLGSEISQFKQNSMQYEL